ncbi:MAG: hypothetical protein ACOC9P_01105, partial [bacterium]
VYLSVRLIPDIHPVSIELAPAMKLTLLLWFVPITLIAAGLIVSSALLEHRQMVRRRANALHDPMKSHSLAMEPKGAT